MKTEKIIRRYYETEINKIPMLEPAHRLKNQVPVSERPGKIRWEDVFGAAVTLGYLIQLLAPSNWFSFGRFLFMFRFGF
jgi:hypothetical protein